MISNRQMKRTLMIELFSTTGLFLSAMADNVQQLIAGMAAAGLYAAYFLKIGQTYDIEQIGMVRKAIYSFRFFLYACFLGSLQKVLVSGMLLEGSSGWYVFLPAFLLAIYVNFGGREKRARLMEALFWFVFLPLFLVLVLAARQIHIPFLFEGGYHPEKSIRIFLCFCSLEILLFFKGSVKEKLKPLTFVFLLNLIIFMVTIGMYGSGITKNSELPVVTIIQMVRLPGGFVERLDIFLLSFWILSLFSIFSAYCFYGTTYWRSSKRKISFINLIFYAGVFLVVVWNDLGLTQLIDVFLNYILWIDLPLAILLPLLGKPRMKRSIAITMMATIMFIVTGCGPERVNIEDRAYVLALGIEKENKWWNISFFLPENECVTIKGKDWAEVENRFQKSSEKKLEMGHLKAVITERGLRLSELEHAWGAGDYSKTILLFETENTMEQLKKEDQKTKDPLGIRVADLAKRNQKEVTIGDYLAGNKKIPKLCIRTDLLMIE